MLAARSAQAVDNKNRGRLVANSFAAPQSAGSAVSLRFTGEAGEYFRIWIVNVCLSVVTLGIYSAWAKVRRKRYFYGNTLLEDAAFEYLADPKAILKGRIIVVAAFAVYSVAGQINPLAGPLLGVLYPYYAYRKKRFFLEHSSFGATPFAFTASAGGYYLVYLKAALMFVLFLVGSAATVGLGALPLYIWFAAYRDGAVARLTWESTRLGGLRFDCGWTTGGLFKLYFLNSLGVIVSAGLLAPWAAVRAARYQLERISLQPGAELGAFLAAAQEERSAVGDEAGDLLGFDFGL